MRLDEQACRALLAGARVGHLATSGADRRPHLVPVCFAVQDDRLVIGTDQKPKSGTRLRRLRNIDENPAVAVLADYYDEDWSRLWWVRADGTALLVDAGPVRDEAVFWLTQKYPQYAADPPRGSVIVLGVERWSGWAFERPSIRSDVVPDSP